MHALNNDAIINNGTNINNGISIAEPLRMEDVQVFSALTGEQEPASSRLKGISLTINKGEWIFLAGVNGSGKSTLARLLAGLSLEGTEGNIRRGFAGDDPAPYVMQQPDAQLFGQTPREELEFVLEWLGWPAADIGRRIDEVLSQVQLHPLGDLEWDQLSGGQRQLTAVAAAMAGSMPLIVFDEATSMMDDRVRVRVRELAEELNRQGTTIVWVTQRLEELTPGKRVIAIGHGQIVFDGETRLFMYGDGSQEPPCTACGLRLPYMASVAMELYRNKTLHFPLPMTKEEWREVMVWP